MPMNALNTGRPIHWPGRQRIVRLANGGNTARNMATLAQPDGLLWEVAGRPDALACIEATSTSEQKPPTQQPSAAQHRRHRSWHRVDSLADLSLPLTALETIDRIISEGFMVAGLALRLFGYLGLGWRWLYNLWRLMMFAMFLLPGFARMIVYYFTSPHVTRSVPYGRKPRQRVDLYIPSAAQTGCQPAPVVIFVTGGAWTIGYKAWGALVGKRLCEQGVLVACLDYRNFPQGNALQMLEDVNTGIAWVLRKIDVYGGDPHQVHLVGQSAGGQLALLALLNQAQQAASGEAVLGAAPVWHPSALRTFVGVSGAYDLEGLAEHLHSRGLYKSLLGTIMSVDGQPAWDLLSPLAAAGRGAAMHVGRFMPPCLLMHGTDDRSVPFESSLKMDAALQEVQANSSVRLFEGKSHTQFLLEDAMAAGRDYLADNILEAVTGQPQYNLHRGLCPGFLIKLASWMCPF